MPRTNPPTLSERSSVWESLCERLYVYLYVFYGKITLLRKTDLYQIPPKPSPVEANPSPEHPGGTPVEPGWNPGGTRWNPGGTRVGSVKTRGNQKSHPGPPFLTSKCQSRCFGQEYANLATIGNVLVNEYADLATISNVLVKNMSIS